MIDAGKEQHGGLWPKNISRTQARDTGMAMVLLCLIAWLPVRAPWLVVLAMALLVVNMVWPMAFKPLGYLWFGLSALLGSVMSRVLLVLVYCLLVVPVGLARRMLGKDSMTLRRWKKGPKSVFVVRDHLFSSEDIEHPF